MAEILFRIGQVQQQVALSRSELYRRMRVGEFPRPVSLTGARAVAWRSSDIDAWIASRTRKPAQPEGGENA